ncbi:hypothetical protein M9Y10_027202 [Tritrichomonas musculus]|uniref:Uncharacterized protein n=1 Tax=Tritrichomonas musculus TaxID=1915356 RepID=A0ABR2H7P3_9EUKA
MLLSFIFPYSLSNVENEWVPEVKKYCPGIPYILVGTKCFLRNRAKRHPADYNLTFVTTEEGEEMKRKIGAQEYIECESSLL